MKNTRLFLLAVAFLLSLPSLHAQNRTADGTVQKLFTSLQQKDENAFLSLYPSSEQFGRFMKSIMEQVMKSDAMKQIFAMDEKTKNVNIDSLIMAEVAKSAGPKEYEAMQVKFKSTFQKTIEKGEAKGVRWSEARLTGFTIDSSSVADKEAEQFNLSGFKEAKGVIDFSVGDAAYQMAFSKMMYFPGENSWFGADIAQLARKGESLAPDAKEEEGEAPPAEKLDNKKGTEKKKAPAARANSTKKAPARKKA